MDIDNHINQLKRHSDNGHMAFVLLRLRNREVIEFINDFIETKNKDVKKDTLSTIKEIIIQCKTIYDLDWHEIPYDDVLYDKMLSKYKKFEKEPFGNASIGSANVKYKYDTLAGTLDKVHFIYDSEKEGLNDDRPSLEEWFKSAGIEKKKIRILANHKKDGTSVVADMVYDESSKSYKINKCTSRGKKDHGEGADISVVGKGIRFNPKSMKDKFGYIPAELGIQYEMVISHKHKTELEKYMNRKFANNRSAITGLLRRMVFATPKEADVLRQWISLVPVGFEFKGDLKNFMEEYAWDEIYASVCATFIYGDVTMGYSIIEWKTIDDLLKDAREYADTLIEKRSKLNHEIDGVVLTILNPSIQKELGRKNHINQWQVAYKFPEQVKKTKIVGLIESTGAFGYKEFLAETEPVYLNGTLQNKGQFHSLDRFKSFNARIGDEVYLKLSGDVIPYMYTDETCERGNGEKLKLPKKCKCETELVEEKNKLRCPNVDCDQRIVGRLVTFLSEVNSKGLAEAACEKLYKTLNITKPSQLLQLTEKDFLKLDGFEKGSSKLAYETIQEIRTRPRKLSVIISSLAIDCFRKSTVEKVLAEISIEEIIKLAKESKIDELKGRLQKAHGVDKNSKIIAEGLIKYIYDFEKICSLMTIKKEISIKTSKTILISGFRNDEEFEEVAARNGYAVKDGVKKYDMLVIKNESYLSKPKAKTAKENGKPIMTYNEFIDKYK